MLKNRFHSFFIDCNSRKYWIYYWMRSIPVLLWPSWPSSNKQCIKFTIWWYKLKRKEVYEVYRWLFVVGSWYRKSIWHTFYHLKHSTDKCLTLRVSYFLLKLTILNLKETKQVFVPQNTWMKLSNIFEFLNQPVIFEPCKFIY